MQELYLLEPRLRDPWLRFGNNAGWVNQKEEAELAHAFSHWTYAHSHGRLMVTDLQASLQAPALRLSACAVSAVAPCTHCSKAVAAESLHACSSSACACLHRMQAHLTELVAEHRLRNISTLQWAHVRSVQPAAADSGLLGLQGCRDGEGFKLTDPAVHCTDLMRFAVRPCLACWTATHHAAHKQSVSEAAAA